MTKYFLLFEACLSSFEEVHNAHAEGATPQYHIQDISQCLDFCRQNPGCLALDFDLTEQPYLNSRCWVHMETNIYVLPASYVDHYSKQFCSKNVGK